MISPEAIRVLQSAKNEHASDVWLFAACLIKEKNMMFVRGYVSPNCSDTIFFERCWDPSPGRFTPKIICQFVIVNSIIPIWPTWLLENSRNFHWRSLKWEPCRVSSWHHFYCQEEPGSPRHKMRRLDEEISQRLGWKKWAKVQGSSLFSAMVPSLEIKALMRAYFHHWFSLIGLIKPLFPAGCVLGGG